MSPVVVALFERCVERVLRSPYLLDRASLHLPLRISELLLYLAFELRNQLAIKKLVSKWPHKELSLNFSNSPLCRRHLHTRTNCIDAHEYAGYFPNYARYSHEELFASLLDAVFHNALAYDASSDRGLRVVDLSDMILRPKQFSLLQNLTRGDFPVTHHSDYVSEREAEILGVSRPFLIQSESRPPLTLFVNVLINEASTRGIKVLSKLCSEKKWMCIKLKGINLLGQGTAVLVSLQSYEISLRSVTHMCLTDASKLWLAKSGLEIIPNSLWLRGQHYIPIPLDCRELLIDVSELNKNQANKLDINLKGLKAFCLLLRFRYCRATEEYLSALRKLLAGSSSSLEYFQLYTSKLTADVMKALHSCARLRVVSVYSTSDASLKFLEVLSRSPLLEFIQWGNTTVKESDITSFCHILTGGFKSLCHFHLRVDIIIWEGTSDDVASRDMSASLTGEGGRAERMVGMLTSLRPDVCFKVLESHSQNEELLEVVSMFDMPSL